MPPTDAPVHPAAPPAAPFLVREPFLLREEAPADAPAREALLDAAFGPGRHLRTCARLREGRRPSPGLALVARDAAGALVGTLRLWDVAAGPGRPALLLGPLAVAAAHRSAGLGGRLVREALARAAAGGHGAVLLVGDAPYYARFGFAPAPAGLALPGPVERARFLALDLRPGALAGAAGLVRPTGARETAGAAPDLAAAAVAADGRRRAA